MLAAAAALVGALAACGAPRTPAAAPPSSSTPPGTSPAAGATPGVTAPTPAPAAAQALSALVAREGAQASALAPAVGQDSPDLAVLARTTDGAGTRITFWAWDGAAFRPAGSVEAGEPLLARREGGAAQWRYLTGGRYPDAVVHLRGGSVSGGVQAVVAQHLDDGTWRFVPFEGQHDGIAPQDDVYADDPLFDDGFQFVTRVSAGGQAVATYWQYAEDDRPGRFERIGTPDPGATRG
ncbi:hypothetical protein [Kineococcus rhizosphaerae]|uniref:Lipoprotein n=1 Tax=Kineococcus rhizosphaerae TaxID=559628 RepID=A0A2T0R740_9ACTN|nr:hypothetical protein [Kineococcus rhizosphaerae]PRY16941.1 hypothetical protein CLV37_103375 [Kineococcus rhizosphaerae]